MRTAVATIAMLILLPVAALAADKLPLKRGIFVDTSVKCSERSNATAMGFWGDELNTARSVGKIRKVVRKGKSFTVNLDIEEMGGSKEKATWSLAIKNSKTFTLTNEFGSWDHRWCADRM
jgi:hypothetical protein